MVHGSTTKKFEKNTRRVSPNKDITLRKNAVHTVVPQKSNTTMPIRRAETVPQEEELLTPEFLLSDYAATKKNLTNRNSTKGEDLKETPAINILELLSKRDNLDKLANSLNMVKEGTPAVPIPVKSCTPSPPVTPKKPTNNNERFAGLPNSPAPSTLPLPSFQFFDQELNKRITKDEDIPTRPEIQKAKSTSVLISKPNHPKENKTKQRRGPSPPTRQHSIHPTPMIIPVVKPIPLTFGNNSPPSNPHLDSMTNQLRMMLNIVPSQS